MSHYFSDVEDFFEKNKIKKPAGCTSTEIESLENSIGFELPKAFKDYLLFMGKDYQGVMRSTDCFIDDVIENTKYLPELLQENKLKFELPENYLAFFCHQGYIMGWFELPKTSENPICYLFNEGTTEYPQEYGNFKHFMTSDIFGNAKLELELRSHKKWWQFWK